MIKELNNINNQIYIASNKIYNSIKITSISNKTCDIQIIIENIFKNNVWDNVIYNVWNNFYKNEINNPIFNQIKDKIIKEII